MDSIRPLATSVRRQLLSGRRALVTLVGLLLVWVVIGFVWALLLGLLLIASLMLGDKPEAAPDRATAIAAATAPPTRAATPTAAMPSAAPTSQDGTGPTLEKAYAKIGLPQLPPFEGLGEVRSYDGPRKIRLMPDNPIEQRFDGKAITFRTGSPMRWVSRVDRKGEKTFVEAKEFRVPIEDITAITWREPDPRLSDSRGRGNLLVEYSVGKGARKTSGLSRPAYVAPHQVTQFRQLRDALSAATGLPVTALPTCLDSQARWLLRRASAPYQVMGSDGRPVMMPPEPL